jgi:hypothetical protein
MNNEVLLHLWRAFQSCLQLAAMSLQLRERNASVRKKGWLAVHFFLRLLFILLGLISVLNSISPESESSGSSRDERKSLFMERYPERQVVRGVTC